MKKKSFGLQQVLNYRQEIEKERSLEFAAARHELARAADLLQEEEESARQLARELTAKSSEGISSDELRLYADFSRHQHQELQRQRQTVEQLGRKAEEKQERLLEAAKEKKVLETYRDKTLQRQRKQLAQREQELLDEIALQQAGGGKP